MDMTGEQRLVADRAKVWAALNDIEILKACIPGCESIERTPDGEMVAKVVAKIGPVKATFNGKVRFENVVEATSYSIVGEGQGGVAGFAKGGADVALSDEPDGGTLLKYDVKAQVGGKLAQLGARLIDSTAKSMAEQFFAKFTELVGGAPAELAASGDDTPAAASPPPAQSEPVAPALAPAPVAKTPVPAWYFVAGAAVVVVLLYILAR